MKGCTPLEVSVNSQSDIYIAILIKAIAKNYLTFTKIFKESQNARHLLDEWHLDIIKTGLHENKRTLLLQFTSTKGK